MKNVLTILLLLTVAFSCPAQNDNANRFYAEDILEYVPAATIFGLKACGVKSKSTFMGQLITTGTAFVVMGITVETLKHTVHSERPDKSDGHGFPSGHAAISFLGADLLFEEYREVSSWIGIGGYAIATATSCLRVKHDRHHWGDVFAGAAIGVGCSRLSEWLMPKLFKKMDSNKSNTTISSAPILYDNGFGLSFCINY